MATMLPKVLEIERHQLADYARVDYAITKGEDEVAALEELCLGPNELRREASVVRDRTVLAVREVRNNMAKRAIKAGDFARAESVRFEFLTREDRHEYVVTSRAIFARFAPCEPADILKRIAKICRAAEMADARVIDLFRRCDPIFVFHRVEPADRGPDRSRAFDTSLLGARPIPPREHAIVSVRSAFAA